MAKKRPFQPTTFVQSKNTETGNPMPKFSKDILRRFAQNAEEIAVLMSSNLVRTMGLSPSAIPILRTAISRIFKDNMRPRFEEISAEDAAHLFSGDGAPTPEQLLRQAKGKAGAKLHWFLIVGVDVDGFVAFQFWPVFIVHPTLSSHPSMEMVLNSIEVSMRKRFAVLLNMRGLPKAEVKL